MPSLVHPDLARPSRGLGNLPGVLFGRPVQHILAVRPVLALRARPEEAQPLVGRLHFARTVVGAVVRSAARPAQQIACRFPESSVEAKAADPGGRLFAVPEREVK